MKALERDVRDVVLKWTSDQEVDPDTLRWAVERIRVEIREHTSDLAEGQTLWLAHLAGAMNRDLTRVETNARRREEGIA